MEKSSMDFINLVAFHMVGNGIRLWVGEGVDDHSVCLHAFKNVSLCACMSVCLCMCELPCQCHCLYVCVQMCVYECVCVFV